jgi:hypothetical protein
MHETVKLFLLNVATAANMPKRCSFGRTTRSFGRTKVK